MNESTRIKYWKTFFYKKKNPNIHTNQPFVVVRHFVAHKCEYEWKGLPKQLLVAISLLSYSLLWMLNRNDVNIKIINIIKTTTKQCTISSKAVTEHLRKTKKPFVLFIAQTRNETKKKKFHTIPFSVVVFTYFYISSLCFIDFIYIFFVCIMALFILHFFLLLDIIRDKSV